MKIKTSELTGAALNWAVNHAERLTGILAPVNYCGKWEHGGPIIEREEIRLDPPRSIAFWSAEKNGYLLHGPTPLIAAMRCYVVSKLGDEVEVPDELH
jgi:hypothetical protein